MASSIVNDEDDDNTYSYTFLRMMTVVSKSNQGNTKGIL